MLRKASDKIKPIIRVNKGAIRKFKTFEIARCSEEVYHLVKKMLADTKVRKTKTFSADVWFDDDGNWMVSLRIKNKKK